MKKIIGIVTPILLLILPYLLFVVLSVGMGRPDRDSSGAYIMAGDSRLQMTQTAICIVYTVVVLLNVVWVIYQTAAGTSAQALLLWDMLMKLCYIPYYLLAAFMVLAGFATFMFGGVAIIGVMWIADVLFLIPPSIYGLCGCIRACSEKSCPWGQQLPCRYCISSLCWTLWRRSSDSVPYTADTNARNRWRLPDSSRCRTGIEQVNAKHNRANRNSLSSAIENRADDNSDIGFARLCSVCWCHEGARTKILKLSVVCGHTTWNVPNLEKHR